MARTDARIRFDARELTERQREVLGLLARGMTNPQIAERLGITLDGAKFHVSGILQRLDVDSREAAVAWWREYNGTPARFTRAMRALVPAGLGKWLIGGAASAVVVIGVAVTLIVAFQHSHDSAKQPAATSPTTAPATTTPSATTVPSVQEWGVGPAARLPDNVVVIVEHGCTQCDGPTTSLERVAVDHRGDEESKTLFPPPALDSGYIYGYAISPSGRELYVTVCSRGYCGGISEVSPDAQTTIYHSMDGGVTWQTENSYGPPSTVSLGSTGWILTTQQFDGSQYSYNSVIYPDAVTAPTSNPPAVPDGLKAALAGQFDEQQGILPVSVAPGGDTIVQWVEVAGDKRTWFVGRLHDGSLQSTFAAPGSITIGGWISNTEAVGNYSLPASNSGGTGAALFARPALLDFDAGQVAPLTIGEEPTDKRGPDRDRIVSVQVGPFAEVHTGGDCLNVRQSPLVTSKSLGCFADGVLLRMGEATSIVEGQEWQSVTTPSGASGWASAQYLVK